MKRLTKAQRDILQSAVAIKEAHGIDQPVHCVMSARADIDKYSKSYATYTKQMYALVDAGVLGEDKECHCYVRVIDYNAARELLAA